MEGIFRKSLNRLYGILGTVSGIGLFGLISFVLAVDPAVKPGDIGYFVFFMIFGLIAAVVSIYSLFVTGRVFLRVTEERIQGFSGLSGRLDCAMSDVAHVAWGGIGLSIELKTGKRYNFNDLTNNYAVGAFIRERTFVVPKVDIDQEELAKVILGLKRKHNCLAIGVLVSVVLMIPEILVAVALTGGRELEQFTEQDWTILGTGTAAVVVTFAVFYVLLRHFVKTQREYERLLSAVPNDE